MTISIAKLMSNIGNVSEAITRGEEVVLTKYRKNFAKIIPYTKVETKVKPTEVRSMGIFTKSADEWVGKITPIRYCKHASKIGFCKFNCK